MSDNGRITENNSEEMADKAWHSTRKRLLENLGFDVEELDSEKDWKLVINND